MDFEFHKITENSQPISLVQMQPNESGKIVEIRAGHRLHRRLEAMGIRSGIEITKISSQPMHGPVIIKMGNTQAALGYGMAGKIMVMRKGE